MANGDEGPVGGDFSRCKWEWLGDQWSKVTGCAHEPPESCGEPGYSGTMIGEIAFTACSS